ncbi:hypothetical protein DFH08DRAFT_971971 [Mycena albidolilacea]|uniref:Uncharacterized protein n=1 Tax=Mycena albidolilacea TaxID=1033008 RepID=A0AAD6ZC57_9AGAR|nr:hypothetical protein DFH08DRAFT_971971 [Mycena albidolilacea]
MLLWPPTVSHPLHPVSPHTGCLSVRPAPPACLPHRSLPKNCALPSQSAPFTAFNTVVAVIGRPAATALCAHLIARAPHQITASIAQPWPPLAEFPGGGVWVWWIQWIDVWVCALCMANVAAPLTTTRPQQRASLSPIPSPPSPPTAACPPPAPPSGSTTAPASPRLPIPAPRTATATACPHQSKDAPVRRRRTIWHTTTPHTTSPQLPGSMYVSPSPPNPVPHAHPPRYAPLPHSTSTIPPLTTMAAAATPDHHAPYTMSAWPAFAAQLCPSPTPGPALTATARPPASAPPRPSCPALSANPFRPTSTPLRHPPTMHSRMHPVPPPPVSASAHPSSYRHTRPRPIRARTCVHLGVGRPSCSTTASYHTHCPPSYCTLPGPAATWARLCLSGCPTRPAA